MDINKATWEGANGVEIARNIQQYLQRELRKLIDCEVAAEQYLCEHSRLCLTNEDRSEDDHWYEVSSVEQVLEIEQLFCPENPRSAWESREIVHTVIIGYDIDFSRPTYMTYDLNRAIPILSDVF